LTVLEKVSNEFGTTKQPRFAKHEQLLAKVSAELVVQKLGEVSNQKVSPILVSLPRNVTSKTNFVELKQYFWKWFILRAI